MNWCILIPLLVGLISAILGYLLGKLSGGNNNNDNDCKEKLAKVELDLEQCIAARKRLELDLENCKSARVKLEADLAACEANKASLSNNISSSFAASTPALIPFDANGAKAVFGKKIKENDLTVVEGIGPKIQELFHNHDVKTWKDLSECTVEKCQAVLDSGGERFKIHKPGTWPKQAQLAYEGKWQELLDWQDQLDGGK